MRFHEGLHVVSFPEERTEICAGMETVFCFPSLPPNQTQLLKSLVTGISRSDYFLRAHSLEVSHDDADVLLSLLQKAELITLRRVRKAHGPDESTWRRIGGETMRQIYHQRSQLKVSLNHDNAWSQMLACHLSAAGVGTIRVSPEIHGFPSNWETRERHTGTTKEKLFARGYKTKITSPRGETDLAIQLSWGFANPVEATVAQRRNQAHLPVVASNDFVEIGPLVIPGYTPCTNCVSHHQVQLLPDLQERVASLAGIGFPQIETCTAAIGAALASTIALAFLDRRSVSSGQVTRVDVNGGIETLNYTPHPKCGCMSPLPEVDLPDQPGYSSCAK